MQLRELRPGRDERWQLVRRRIQMIGQDRCGGGSCTVAFGSPRWSKFYSYPGAFVFEERIDSVSRLNNDILYC
jgi:hypothetical protein